jgi:hypothetical protein
MPHINETMLVGVGGVGSALLQPLAALLANDPDCYNEPDRNGVPTRPKLTIVDGDDYEEKNLRNQCITPQDVGTNKAEHAATVVSGLVDVSAWARYLAGPLEIQSWLVTQRARQQKRIDAGVFGGVALIIIPVDNDHCRNYVYRALEEVPNVSVLVIDPSNGAGDDAECVDVVTYLRVYNGQDLIEPWPSPLVKFVQLQNPPGRAPHVGCAEKAEALPQLRTSNMMAAMLSYACVEMFLTEQGMPEGYIGSSRTMEVRPCGSRLPTAEEMK